jgi:hypothetical protein
MIDDGEPVSWRATIDTLLSATRSRPRSIVGIIAEKVVGTFRANTQPYR